MSSQSEADIHSENFLEKNLSRCSSYHGFPSPRYPPPPLASPQRPHNTAGQPEATYHANGHSFAFIGGWLVMMVVMLV